MQHRCYAIIPAAGCGQRMATSTPKQYLLLHDKMILEHTLSRLIVVEAVAKIVLVLAKDDLKCDYFATHYPDLIIASGGAERSDSVLNGIQALQGDIDEQDWLLVHDAVRPCVRLDDIERLLTSLQDDSVGGLLGVPCRDTLKKVGADNAVLTTVARDPIWQAQTPQVFRHAVLVKALQHCQDHGIAITDEASAVEQLGLQPKIIQGHSDNIKITYPADLALAEKLLET